MKITITAEYQGLEIRRSYFWDDGEYAEETMNDIINSLKEEYEQQFTNPKTRNSKKQ